MPQQKRMVTGEGFFLLAPLRDNFLLLIHNTTLEIKNVNPDSIFLHHAKILKTGTIRGGSNDHGRFFVRAIFPQASDREEALQVFYSDLAQKFPQLPPIQGGGYVKFETRKHFSLFVALYLYVHGMGGYLISGNWDRGWLKYSETQEGRVDCSSDSCTDETPIFWAMLAAAQMYYGND